MLSRTLVVAGCLILGIGFSGCVVKNDKKKSDPVTAAQALTKSVSFEGGTLIEEAFPDPTAKSVELLGDSSDAIEPGDEALMSFDVTPGDSDVAAALVQFGEDEAYFLIEDDAFKGAADGGAAEAAHVELAFSTKADVCKELCDTVHQVGVTRAVKLRGGKISAHESATLALDCTSRGDHELCTGDEPGPGKPTDRDDAAVVGGENPDGGLIRDGDGGTSVGLVGHSPALCEMEGETCEGIDEYIDCVMKACDAVYKECLGAAYTTGDYSGSVCEAYGECYDNAADPCNADCTADRECDTCLGQTASCSQSCYSLIDCGNISGGDGGVVAFPDSGIDFTKTCDDFDACCLTLEPSLMESCQMAADIVRPSGDVACSAAISSYCP